METIVLATDFSQQSDAAREHALELARRLASELYLVHILDDSMRDHYDDVRARLEQMQQECIDAGVTTTSRVVIGFPDTGLVSTATELRADLLVVGTHGRTGVQRFLMGSVAERVTRMSETDVFVARARRAGVSGYQRVLVPTDFSATAERALALATTLVASGGTIDLFHSWQIPGAVTGYWGPSADQGAAMASLRDELRDAAVEQATALAERHGADVSITVSAAEGTAPSCIRHELDAGTYDLVVMGSHGRRGFRRWMLGSVAETTVRYAPCSVVVVHAQRGSRGA